MPHSPFVPTHPPLTRTAALKLFPETALEVIDPLALIWDEVVHRIICEMMDIAKTDEVPLHINLREEMVLELAQLQLWLGDAVVEKRMIGRDPSVVNVDQEREECLGSKGSRLISGTAHVAHDRIWSKRIEERWKPKSAKAIEREANPRRAKLAVKPVDKNHFIPKWFIRDHWAVDGKILRWRRGRESWSSAQCGFGQWGFRRNLYSDRLEAYFGLLEGDAKKPIQMLLETKPLNGPQRESLVGFLIVQILRNPAFLEALAKHLALKLSELGHVINDPEFLRTAHEAIYSNNDFYNQLAHPIMWSRWAIVKTVQPLFVLPDTFGAHGDLGDGVRIIVPLTPRACFVTLPSNEDEKSIVPSHLAAEERLSHRISRVLIDSAANEFLSHPVFQPDEKIEKFPIASVLKEIEVAIDQS